VEQVGLVDEQHRVDLFGAELFDVGADREEDGRRRGARREAEGETDVAVEVAPAERDVVAVGQTKAVLRQPVTQGAQDAGLAYTGLAREHRVPAVATGLDEGLHGGLSRGRHPQLAVGDLLGEGRFAQAKVR
jgi:hypothetical protein